MAKGMAAANNGNRVVNWDDYHITTSPNDIGLDTNFRDNYTQSLSVKYHNNMYYFSNRYNDSWSNRTARSSRPVY